LNVNPARPGAAYGYVDMGGWIGGQAEYVMVPYADFNLLKFPDRKLAMEKLKASFFVDSSDVETGSRFAI
jgi:glutathione-independent formaldehyde dehydrogenase